MEQSVNDVVQRFGTIRNFTGEENDRRGESLNKGKLLVFLLLLEGDRFT